MEQIMLDNLRLIRKIRNLTQEDIASQLKISQSNYAKIENGNTKMSVSMLIKLSKILNTSLNSFFEKPVFVGEGQVEYKSHSKVSGEQQALYDKLQECIDNQQELNRRIGDLIRVIRKV